MEYIFIHGLGQNSTSWNETVSNIKNITIPHITQDHKNVKIKNLIGILFSIYFSKYNSIYNI